MPCPPRSSPLVLENIKAIAAAYGSSSLGRRFGGPSLPYQSPSMEEKKFSRNCLSCTGLQESQGSPQSRMLIAEAHCVSSLGFTLIDIPVGREISKHPSETDKNLSEMDEAAYGLKDCDSRSRRGSRCIMRRLFHKAFPRMT